MTDTAFALSSGQGKPNERAGAMAVIINDSQHNTIRQANRCNAEMQSVLDNTYAHFIKDSDWTIPPKSRTAAHIHKQIVILRAELKRLDYMLGFTD